MNIRLAYNFDLDLFQTLFPGTKLFDWKRDENLDIDLLIFSGGEDVSLEYYLDEDNIQRYSHLCHTNPDRDDKEIEILRGAINGDLKVNKILGVCRGLQLFNVMFGGSLYFDLQTYELAHSQFHTIYHKLNSNVDFFKTVNSMHHQGVRNMGDNLHRLELEMRSYPKIVATDNSGQVLEIGTWLNDKLLGVQFHPEYYNESNKDKDKFREFISAWISGETTILK